MSSFQSATFSLFALFVLCLIRLIHLDHTHTRPHHFHNLKHLIRPRHVHAHTQIRAFAVHDRQDPPRGRVGVQSDARGVCLERRWVRHLVHVVGWGESVGKKSWRLGKWMRTSKLEICHSSAGSNLRNIDSRIPQSLSTVYAESSITPRIMVL